MYIKSRLLVPSNDDPSEDIGSDLERQLRLYKAFVDAAKQVQVMWGAQRMSFTRDGFAIMEPIFNPPPHVGPDELRDILLGVLRELEPITRLPLTVMIRTVNIRETIARVREKLVTERKARFHDMLAQAKTKTEAIVTFLALLELVKQRTILIAQTDRYGDIEIELITDEPPVAVTEITNV